MERGRRRVRVGFLVRGGRLWWRVRGRVREESGIDWRTIVGGGWGWRVRRVVSGDGSGGEGFDLLG